MEEWFNIRRNIYELRIERIKLLIKLKIFMLQQIYTFIQCGLNFKGKTKDEATKILEEN